MLLAAYSTPSGIRNGPPSGGGSTGRRAAPGCGLRPVSPQGAQKQYVERRVGVGVPDAIASFVHHPVPNATLDILKAQKLQTRKFFGPKSMSSRTSVRSSMPRAVTMRLISTVGAMKACPSLRARTWIELPQLQGSSPLGSGKLQCFSDSAAGKPALLHLEYRRSQNALRVQDQAVVAVPQVCRQGEGATTCVVSDSRTLCAEWSWNSTHRVVQEGTGSSFRNARRQQKLVFALLRRARG